MGRRDLQVQYARCNQGINQRVELASLEDECADARNVWAPDGRIIQRPGYYGVAVILSEFSEPPGNFQEWEIVKEDPIGTFTTTNDLSNLPVGGRWYLMSMGGEQFDGRDGVALEVTNTNTSAAWANAEYWNGYAWAPLMITEGETPQNHLSQILSKWIFPVPRDVADITINGITGKAIRFTIQGAALDASVLIATAPGTGTSTVLESFSNTGFIYTTQPTLFKVEFPYTKRYFSVQNSFDQNTGTYSSSFYRNTAQLQTRTAAELVTSTSITYTPDEPATIAAVTQFEEFYVAYNRIVTVHKAYPAAADDVIARVESDPLIVGPGGAFDVSQISQLSSWPKSKYITFFGGQLWAANLDDSGNYSIRWSAPVPFYKVWPTDNIETLMEDDNSEITGLKGYQQSMTIFKEDSIWQMVDSGVSDFALQTYAPQRVVAGVGCVSNSSIVEIQGRLIFLAEDGIYAYDGTPNIQKLSDNIQNTINSISPGSRKFCTGANLSRKSLYLLAVSTDGSGVNNLIIVWDYKNNSWWFWDNIEAQAWLLDEDDADNQRLYFQNTIGQVFQLFVGNTNYGGTTSDFGFSDPEIESSVTTHRFQYNLSNRDVGDLKYKLRSIEVTSNNEARNIDVTAYGNDEGNGTTGAIVLTDEAEADWSELVWAVDTYTPDRRRKRRIMFNKNLDMCQVKVTHDELNTPFEMSAVGVGFVPLGKR